MAGQWDAVRAERLKRDIAGPNPVGERVVPLHGPAPEPVYIRRRPLDWRTVDPMEVWDAQRWRLAKSADEWLNDPTGARARWLFKEIVRRLLMAVE